METKELIKHLETTYTEYEIEKRLPIIEEINRLKKEKEEEK